MLITDPGVEPKVLDVALNWEPLSVNKGYDIVYLASYIEMRADGKQIGSISSSGEKAASYPTQERYQRPVLHLLR